MKNFNELGLAEPLLQAIEELGYEHPMPVQEEVIPYLLSNETDLVALAQTGTGKTAAYGLPLLQKIVKTKTHSDSPQTHSDSPLKGEDQGKEASPLRGGLVGSGVPFLVRPTDVLPSPIVLENVRIETDTPQAVTAEGKIFTGTFQRTGDTPAFSATITDDPVGIGEVKNENSKGKNETSWYDLGGSRVPFPAKGGIYVTKGKKVRQ